jgi:hypothetical protein
MLRPLGFNNVCPHGLKCMLTERIIFPKRPSCRPTSDKDVEIDRTTDYYIRSHSPLNSGRSLSRCFLFVEATISSM